MFKENLFFFLWEAVNSSSIFTGGDGVQDPRVSLKVFVYKM